MREIVDLGAGAGGEGRVVGDGVVGDGDEKDGEMACKGGWNRHGGWPEEGEEKERGLRVGWCGEER